MKQFLILFLLGISFSVFSQDINSLHNIWVLEKLNGNPVVIESGMITLEIFVEDQKYLGNGGCNNYSGGIEKLFDDRIGFGNAITTKMYCQKTADLETEYFQALSEVRYWSMTDDGMLKLLGEDQKELLLFGHTD